jgi:microcystin-dependent protein
MAIRIVLKKSAVQNKKPVLSDLHLGEVAINTYDGKMFFIKDDGNQSIVELTELNFTTITTALNLIPVNRAGDTMTGSLTLSGLPTAPLHASTKSYVDQALNAVSFIGEMKAIAFNFAPTNWMLCQGQSLLINDHSALFNVIGNQFGGDGITTFSLPDLRGRVVIQQGTGPLDTYTFGSIGGTNSTTLNSTSTFTLTDPSQLPSHTHNALAGTLTGTVTIHIPVNTGSATDLSPNNTLVLASAAGPANRIYSTNAANATLKPFDESVQFTGGAPTIVSTGSSQPINVPVSVTMPAVLPPYMAMNYIICVVGKIPA